LFRGDSVFIDQNLPGNSYTVTLDVIGPTTGSYAALTVGNAEATLALSAAAETLSVAGLTTLSAGTINISNTSTLSTGTFLGVAARSARATACSTSPVLRHCPRVRSRSSIAARCLRPRLRSPAAH
jgi:hypothetical protein